ncbi:MAG: transposase [Synergistaceae bacterium]|nr:transposase [Synergistaceae bacterium]
MRVYCNEKATLFTANSKKDAESVKRDDVLPKFQGIVSHDHEKKFYGFGTGDATCGAHLLRNLKGLRELYKCPWARVRGFLQGYSLIDKHDFACILSEYIFILNKYD